MFLLPNSAPPTHFLTALLPHCLTAPHSHCLSAHCLAAPPSHGLTSLLPHSLTASFFHGLSATLPNCLPAQLANIKIVFLLIFVTNVSRWYSFFHEWLPMYESRKKRCGMSLAKFKISYFTDFNFFPFRKKAASFHTVASPCPRDSTWKVTSSLLRRSLWHIVLSCGGLSCRRWWPQERKKLLYRPCQDCRRPAVFDDPTHARKRVTPPSSPTRCQAQERVMEHSGLAHYQVCCGPWSPTSSSWSTPAGGTSSSTWPDPREAWQYPLRRGLRLLHSTCLCCLPCWSAETGQAAGVPESPPPHGRQTAMSTQAGAVEEVYQIVVVVGFRPI